MHFVKRLGYRYLWVDALCIIQDDLEERKRLIHGMGCVYEGAACTIICAAGADANAGLRGISPRNRSLYDRRFTVPGRHGRPYTVALARPALAEEVKRSHWNGRGWTYQELCLSHRAFYFTAHEVFYSCQACHRRESYALEEADLSNLQAEVRSSSPWWSYPEAVDPYMYPHSHYRGLPTQPEQLHLGVYQIVVREYTKRELTFDLDVINAFQGIFNRFMQQDGTYMSLAQETQAIPPRFLPHALFWYPVAEYHNVPQQPLTATMTRGKTGCQFSTWSWVSWRGPVEFLFAKHPNRPLGFDNVVENTADPSELGSLLLSPGLDNFGNAALSKEMINTLQRTIPDDFEKMDASQERRSNLSAAAGVLDFWAPVLRRSSVIFQPLWRLAHLEIRSSDNPGVTLSKEGRFYFDDPHGPLDVDDFVAILVSKMGTINVIGLVKTDRDTYHRVGIGYIASFTSLFTFHNLLEEEGAWELRHIQLS